MERGAASCPLPPASCLPPLATRDPPLATCHLPLARRCPRGYNLSAMDMETRYQETLDYLYSFVDFSLTHQDGLSLDDFNLVSMRTLVDELGDPHQAYPSIHIAGTKGKGSVCAFCAAALQEQGYKVGLYTSPHLKDFEERIQINGEPIPRVSLVALVDEIKPYVDSIPDLTTFHIATALAFWYFARQKVDVAVIEVGLGGRLDSTNVITPLVSVITALYLEHTSILGDTLPQIAAEKAGIIKPGVPVVLSPQREDARQVVARIAAEQNAPLTQVGVDYLFEGRDASLDGQSLIVWLANASGHQDSVELRISLLGPHQIENAATAYIALQALREQGIAIREDAIRAGFAKAEWPARFEVLRREPPVIIDAAHTPDAAQKLRQTLDEFFPQHPVVLVFGVSEDKDIRGMLTELLPKCQQIICTKSTHPRALDAGELLKQVLPFGCPVKAVENVGEALEYASKIAADEAAVLVTGSSFVAACARIAWFESADD
ncbi:MAG: bifunctional folylpolyglutamate synthase/dihydrofolate synthase [Chloroflexi bacterium]|nr:bifunctional folylpolyglutamate synthase/dihydrofolate synthase [Chloroflexota bacterium]